jgi:hypothetical protein
MYASTISHTSVKKDSVVIVMKQNPKNMLASLLFYILQNGALREVSLIFRISLYISFRKSDLSFTPNKEVAQQPYYY